VEQILAVAPILPGQGSQSTPQKPQQGTPSRASVQQQQYQQQQQHQQQQSPRQQPPQQQQRPAQNDLIDFGQNDARSAPTQPQMQNIAPGGAPVQNITSEHVTRESVPVHKTTSGSGSTQNVTNKMAGMNLQDPLQPRIHRLDSTDGCDEEFVDAES